MILLVLGGRKASREAIIRVDTQGNAITTKKAKPLIRNANGLFKYKAFAIPLPRKLIEWQLLQNSTLVYPPEIGLHGQYGAVTHSITKD